MRQRLAFKSLNSTNYYLFFENPLNGKICYHPKPGKYARQLRRSCNKLHCTDLFWGRINNRIKEAFDNDWLNKKKERRWKLIRLLFLIVLDFGYFSKILELFTLTDNFCAIRHDMSYISIIIRLVFLTYIKKWKMAENKSLFIVGISN